MFFLGLIIGLVGGGTIFWFFNDQIRVGVAKAFGAEQSLLATYQGVAQTLKAAVAAKTATSNKNTSKTS
jgi:hypothetical protein